MLKASPLELKALGTMSKAPHRIIASKKGEYAGTGHFALLKKKSQWALQDIDIPPTYLPLAYM